MISIIFDGVKRDISLSECTLKSFLETEDLKKSIILIRINGEIVLYKDHETCLLNNGDKIDVEHILLGGG